TNGREGFSRSSAIRAVKPRRFGVSERRDCNWETRRTPAACCARRWPPVSNRRTACWKLRFEPPSAERSRFAARSTRALQQLRSALALRQSLEEVSGEALTQMELARV